VATKQQHYTTRGSYGNNTAALHHKRVIWQQYSSITPQEGHMATIQQSAIRALTVESFIFMGM